MRIACPSCAVTYDVPDSRLKPGRKLRCARCNTEWAPVELEAPVAAPPSSATQPFEGPVDDEPPPPSPGRLAVSAMDLLAAHRKRQESPRSLRIAWIASIVVLVGLVAAGLIWRRGIMVAWPPSGRLYGLVGLAAAPEVPMALPGAQPADRSAPQAH